jgi:hypothetical protein
VTAVIAVATLAVVACGAVKFWQAHKRVEAVLRGDWCDCPVCAPEVARLRALFNDTPKEN